MKYPDRNDRRMKVTVSKKYFPHKLSSSNWSFKIKNFEYILDACFHSTSTLFDFSNLKAVSESIQLFLGQSDLIEGYNGC